MLSKFVRETPFDTFKLGGLAGLTTLAATIAVGSFPTNEGKFNIVSHVYSLLF